VLIPGGYGPVVSTYKEEVVIGKPLSLIGAGADRSVIDATGLAHGIFVDGYDNPGLNDLAGLHITEVTWKTVALLRVRCLSAGR